MFEMTPATSENQCTRLKKGYKLKYTFATAHSRNSPNKSPLTRFHSRFDSGMNREHLKPQSNLGSPQHFLSALKKLQHNNKM